MNPVETIVRRYLDRPEADALLHQAEGLTNAEIGDKYGVTGEWVRRLANRARARLAVPEVRKALLAEAPPAAEAGPEMVADFGPAWGFHVKTVEEMKQEEYQEKQAEAAAIRRAMDRTEIISEEIAELI